MEEIIETKVNKHWVLNNPNTEIGSTLSSTKKIKDSIDINLDKIKSKISTVDERSVHVKTEGSFEIPSFSDVFSIKEGKNYSLKTQRWIGHVIEIRKDAFVAKLVDAVYKGTYEIGEFDIYEVTPEDRDLLQKGAIFYWSVGYVMTKGQLKKESIMRFRRVVEWTEEDYNIAIDRANDLLNSIHWED
jgi:hypothetical protein